jgi:hypothetical protein
MQPNRALTYVLNSRSDGLYEQEKLGNLVLSLERHIERTSGPYLKATLYAELQLPLFSKLDDLNQNYPILNCITLRLKSNNNKLRDLPIVI